jgi:membrane protein required for colicin V production
VDELRTIDMVAGTLLGVAMLRGVWLGLIREAFSIGALGGAVIAVRLGGPAFAGVLAERTDIDALFAPYVSGALIAMATVAVVAILGRVLHRGAQAAGLGWADRLGGAALGVAEGAVLAGILLVIGTATLGRTHPMIRDTRSLAALVELERLAGDDVPRIDVAAPPR